MVRDFARSLFSLVVDTCWYVSNNGASTGKLELLRMKGSSLEAFTFKDAFTEPDHSAVGDSWRLVISMIVA